MTPTFKRSSHFFFPFLSVTRPSFSSFILSLLLPQAPLIFSLEKGLIPSLLSRASPTPPQYVLWYHNSKMINYDTTRGGVQVRTEQGQKTESHLTIHEAKDSDSGNYTCSASNTQPAYIHVFVSDGVEMYRRDIIVKVNTLLEHSRPPAYSMALFTLRKALGSIWFPRPILGFPSMSAK
ncbi:unnamed protein product [Nezara viridula]|uniref:Ig-like domain-containing protein n=1 Tax=Nezara viridula TaxID=85310 RepID=A0A9P0H8F2_NEZVI|nr:unnamed protein product [Nezara viridula]